VATDIELIDTVPVLNVSSLERSLAFYHDRLGFETAFNIGTYAGVRRGALTIHLAGADPEFSARPTCCRFHIHGVDKLYAELKPQGVVKPDEELATWPHGMRQFSVLDLDGNRITFAEPVRR
jgi:catechol 2,3-dioxygenase-like lactoylglutathione lyase family enzyme